MSIFSTIWDVVWTFFWIFAFVAYLIALFSIVTDLWGVTLLVDSRYQEGTTRRDVIETQEVHPGVQG